jgi:hypothetical protein
MVERPTLGTPLSGGGRATAQGALAAIEARQVPAAACQGRPDVMADPTRENNQSRVRDLRPCASPARSLQQDSRSGLCGSRGPHESVRRARAEFQSRFELDVKTAMPEKAPLRENRRARWANWRMRRPLRYARGRSSMSDSLLRCPPTVFVLPPTPMSGTFCRS